MQNNFDSKIAVPIREEILAQFKERIATAGLGDILIRLWTFGQTVVGAGFEKAAQTQGVEAPPGTPQVDVLAGLAGKIRGPMTSFEGEVLLKSLNETLFECADIPYEEDPAELQVRMRSVLSEHGPEELLQRFLTAHFFNLLWIRIADVAAQRFTDEQEFENAVSQLEEVCRESVHNSLQSNRPSGGFSEMTPDAARALVEAAGRHLWEDLEAADSL